MKKLLKYIMIAVHLFGWAVILGAVGDCTNDAITIGECMLRGIFGILTSIGSLFVIERCD